MDREKRKREDETENVKKKKKSAKEEEGEVEEFYAILRRIHVAVKYFEKGDGLRRRKMTAVENVWKPTFEVEDFQFHGDDGVNKDGGVESDSCAIRDNDDSVLDLNIEPTHV